MTRFKAFQVNTASKILEHMTLFCSTASTKESIALLSLTERNKRHLRLQAMIDEKKSMFSNRPSPPELTGC